MSVLISFIFGCKWKTLGYKLFFLGFSCANETSNMNPSNPDDPANVCEPSVKDTTGINACMLLKYKNFLLIDSNFFFLKKRPTDFKLVTAELRTWN